MINSRIKENKKGKKVFVGISGGVDSSVAAALLQKEGYEVTGVFIKTWQPPFIECTSRDDKRDAMRVCARLGIPFLLCDGEEAYKNQVVDYMVSEYEKGRTPNPDLMCNKYVKFGVFYRFAKEHGADLVATGHYAQIKDSKLFKAVDNAKDQSYFLSHVPSEVLKETLFPIGHLPKAEVRKLATRCGLFTAEKKDSQGLCFMGKLDIKAFLRHMIEERGGKVEKGEVHDEKGEVIGEHDGALLSTIGERHGLRLFTNGSDASPLYVLAKDIEKNVLVVGPKSQAHLSKRIILGSANILDSTKWKEGEKCSVQYRYHGESIGAMIGRENEAWTIELEKPRGDIALGQSAVLYTLDQCLGGAIIEGLTA